jgi:hypothetical protein
MLVSGSLAELKDFALCKEPSLIVSKAKNWHAFEVAPLQEMHSK